MAKGMWVILNVASVQKSVEFYKGLGLKAKTTTQGPMTWGEVATSSPDAGLVLVAKDQIAPGQAPDTKEWLSGELGKGVLVAIGVPKAARVHEKAVAMRARLDQPLRDQEWGGQEFTLVDPDGYVVNVTDRFPGPRPARKTKPKPKARRAVAKKAKGQKRRR